MPRGATLRAHVEALILDHAARVWGERGEAGSVADVAAAAGVARSTLYRYYPNRDALLDALAEAGMREIREQLAAAGLETVPVREALARLTRGLLVIGAKYTALTRLRPKPGSSTDHGLENRLIVIFKRGIDEGALRADLRPGVLAAAYTDLIEGAIKRNASASGSIESISATVLTIFLDGAGNDNSAPVVAATRSSTYWPRAGNTNRRKSRERPT